MIVSELTKKKSTLSYINCVLCRNDTKLGVKIKKIGNSFGAVCEECAKTFKDEEIELMHNMFTAFGGYYNSMSNSKETSYSKLEEIAKDYTEKNKDINNIENDIKTLHSAFLYGISPQQLVKGLKLLVD
ncbi:MAG: hypothetical protein KGD74_06230 [Candidatus Lokiarchaeota archaeon]|nr:hypothetical protein [Candidatus Lokiarchaeota archaeon]